MDQVKLLPPPQYYKAHNEQSFIYLVIDIVETDERQ